MLARCVRPRAEGRGAERGCGAPCPHPAGCRRPARGLSFRRRRVRASGRPALRSPHSLVLEPGRPPHPSGFVAEWSKTTKRLLFSCGLIFTYFNFFPIRKRCKIDMPKKVQRSILEGVWRCTRCGSPLLRGAVHVAGAAHGAVHGAAHLAWRCPRCCPQRVPRHPVLSTVLPTPPCSDACGFTLLPCDALLVTRTLGGPTCRVGRGHRVPGPGPRPRCLSPRAALRRLPQHRGAQS